MTDKTEGQLIMLQAVTAGSSWFLRMLTLFTEHLANIVRIFMTLILIISDLEHDQLAKGICHPKAKSWPSICCAVTDKTEQLMLL